MLAAIVSQNSFVLVFVRCRTIIARYVAKWGIAQKCLCETKYQAGVSHHFRGVLTSLKKYRAIWGHWAWPWAQRAAKGGRQKGVGHSHSFSVTFGNLFLVFGHFLVTFSLFLVTFLPIPFAYPFCGTVMSLELCSCFFVAIPAFLLLLTLSFLLWTQVSLRVCVCVCVCGGGGLCGCVSVEGSVRLLETLPCRASPDKEILSSFSRAVQGEKPPWNPKKKIALKISLVQPRLGHTPSTAGLRGPVAILFISRDTLSDSIAKCFRACFPGVSHKYRAICCKMGYRTDMSVYKKAPRGGIAPSWGIAAMAEKVSRDRGYRSDTIATSRDTGPLSGWDFPEEILGKTPETLSELFLEFPSRVRLGSPKPYHSMHLRLPEHFKNSLPTVRLGTPLFSEVVPERASQSRSWKSQNNHLDDLFGPAKTCIRKLEKAVSVLVTRIAPTANRKSLATAIATQTKSLRLRKHL